MTRPPCLANTLVGVNEKGTDMLIRSLIGAVGVTAALTAGVTTGPAHAASVEHFTEIEHLHESWGTCSPGDELIADWTVRQAVTVFPSGRATLHLRAVGTITRTGTGIVAKYSEKQSDFEFNDGSMKIVGLLSHLVVPGGHGFAVAGHARIGPDGTLVSVTPGLDALFELEENGAAIICGALTD